MLWWPPNDGRQCVMILKKQQETAVILVLLVVKSMIMMELLILPRVDLSFNVSKDIDFEWFWYIEGHLERRLQPSRDLHPSRPPTQCGNFGGMAVCWHLICWMLHFALCFPFFTLIIGFFCWHSNTCTYAFTPIITHISWVQSYPKNKSATVDGIIQCFSPNWTGYCPS